MFGFGKKKKDVDDNEGKILAYTAWEGIHGTQKEVLEEFDKYLVDKRQASYEHQGTFSYFTGSVHNSLEIMSYCFGFVLGVCQSHGKDEVFGAEVMVYFGQMYEKANINYLNAMDKSLVPNRTDQRTFLDIFDQRFIGNVFATNEDASTAMIAGMAEGKDYSDISQAVEKDYSVLKDPTTASKFGLAEFRGLLKGWMAIVLSNEQMAALMTFPRDWSDSQIDAELDRLGLNDE